MAANIELIKKLREEMGGIGMSDCRKALEESDNNYEEAIVWLRKKGIVTAAKKASRVAAEGLVGVYLTDNLLSASIVEVNSETDFVAGNASFQKLVSEIVQNSISVNGDLSALNASMIGKDTVEEAITLATATIGEKIALRRAGKITTPNGVVATYIHNAVSGQPSLGKIGVLLGMQSSADPKKLSTVGRQICMHIASMAPKFLSISEVDPSELAKEKAILTEQASGSGKPPAVIEKMVEGRISKFYSEVVLLEQPFVMDPKLTIKDVLSSLSKELGAEVKLTKFILMKVGEGIEKVETDFAAEVASLV